MKAKNFSFTSCPHPQPKFQSLLLKCQHLAGAWRETSTAPKTYSCERFCQSFVTRHTKPFPTEKLSPTKKVLHTRSEKFSNWFKIIFRLLFLAFKSGFGLLWFVSTGFWKCLRVMRTNNVITHRRAQPERESNAKSFWGFSCWLIGLDAFAVVVCVSAKFQAIGRLGGPATMNRFSPLREPRANLFMQVSISCCSSPNRHAISFQ